MKILLVALIMYLVCDESRSLSQLVDRGFAKTITHSRKVLLVALIMYLVWQCEGKQHKREPIFFLSEVHKGKEFCYTMYN
jgi:hypothetical protein